MTDYEQEETVIDTNVVVSSTGWNKINWKKFERMPSEHEKQVASNQKLLGMNAGEDFDVISNITSDLTAFGDTFWDVMKPSIDKYLYVEKSKLKSKTETPKETKKSNTSKKLSKKEIIQMNNENRAKEEIKNAISSLNDNEFTPMYAIISKVLEIKGIVMLYFGWYLFNKQSELNKTMYYPNVMEMIITIDRWLSNMDISVTNYFDKSIKNKISSQLIQEVNKWFVVLCKIYPYNTTTINNVAPHLLVTTDLKYIQAIPTLKIKPRQHQIDLIDALEKNYQNGCLIGNMAPLGSGKTTVVQAIGWFIMKLRNPPLSYSNKMNNENDYSKTKLLFVCETETVRDSVGLYCYHAGIHFGLTKYNPITEEFKIVKQNNCRSEDDIIVILADAEKAHLLLSKITIEEFENTWLLIDEPTIGSDLDDNINSQKIIKLLMNPPKVLMLFSASLPKFEHLPSIVSNYKLHNNLGNIVTIHSNEIQIGIDLFNLNRKYITSYLDCQNSNELKQVIEKTKINPFLNRLYTSNVCFALYNSMIEKAIKDVPNILEILSDPNNMSSNFVRKICMNLLEILSEQDNEIIKDVCNFEIIIETKKEKSDDLFSRETNQNDPSTEPINYSKLGTSQSTIFMGGQTLIVDSNPCDFALRNFNQLLTDIYNDVVDVSSSKSISFKSMKHEIARYKKKLQEFEEKKKSSDKADRNKHSEDRKSKLEREKEASLKELKIEPKIDFPEHCIIGSIQHIKKYSPHIRKIKLGTQRNMNFKNIPFDDINVSDEILTLLFAGVGIYTDNICNVYRQTVMDLASKGELAYVISDYSICYGTNYPFTCVLVTDEFVKSCKSIYTVFQALARGGRYGVIHLASGYITDNIVQMLLSYIKNPNDISIEAINMEKTFVNLMNAKEKQDELNILKACEKLEKIHEPSSKTQSLTVINNSNNNKPLIEHSNNTKKQPIERSNDRTKEQSFERSNDRTKEKPFERSNFSRTKQEPNENSNFSRSKQELNESSNFSRTKQSNENSDFCRIKREEQNEHSNFSRSKQSNESSNFSRTKQEQPMERSNENKFKQPTFWNSNNKTNSWGKK